MRIRNLDGILSNEIPVGKVVWVDSINGIDELARRGRITIPFRTLLAAQSAAAAGDTIVVLPGDYAGENLGKAGCAWFFYPGVTVTKAQGSNPLFVMSENFQNYEVRGYGRFISQWDGPIISISGQSTVYFDAESVFGDNASAAAMIQVTGAGAQVQLSIRNMISQGPSVILDISSAANLTLKAESLDCGFGGNIGIQVSANSDLIGYVDRITAETNALKVTSVNGGTTRITTREITAASGPSIKCSGNSFVSIIGSRVVTENAGSTAIEVVEAVGGTNSTTLKLHLYNCVLISGSGTSVGILGVPDGATNPNPSVACYGSIIYNKSTFYSNLVTAPSIWGISVGNTSIL